MIRNRSALFDAMDKAGLPSNLRLVWNSNVPERVKHIVQNPTVLFEAFVRHPEAFPSPDELLILWQTNGTSIVGLLQGSGVFIRNHLEDGPDKTQILGKTYQQAISELFSQLISRGVSNPELESLSQFFGFRFVNELRRFMESNSNWEESTARFIEEIECK